MDVRIKRIEDGRIPQCFNGNWMDTYVRQVEVIRGYQVNGEFNFKQALETFTEGTVQYNPGDIIICRLGFAIELPKGFELHLLPRSGTFRKTGLILTNSMGIGDDTYIGDNDEYLAVLYATRRASFDIGDRLIQIRIEESMQNKYNLIEVDYFGNQDRGGYGSTGK